MQELLWLFPVRILCVPVLQKSWDPNSCLTWLHRKSPESCSSTQVTVNSCFYQLWSMCRSFAVNKQIHKNRLKKDFSSRLESHFLLIQYIQSTLNISLMESRFLEKYLFLKTLGTTKSVTNQICMLKHTSLFFIMLRYFIETRLIQ